MNKKYSDLELLEMLINNGYNASYSMLQIFKEGLESGKITLEEDVIEEVSEEETIKEEVKPEPKNIFEGISKKPVYTKDQFYKSRTNELLETFLIENSESKIFENLTEDTKTESIKEIASQLLRSIIGKLEGIDTTAADRSRGDIKSLRELQSIQEAITQLEALLERTDGFYPDLKKAVGTVIKSILYINQYSNVFKDAYRNKKTLMMVKYQSLILSIISTVSYLISAGIDFSGNDVRLKDQVSIEDVTFIKTLSQFNQSVESGEFKKIVSDMTLLREHFTEVPVEDLSKLLEASEILPTIIGGIKNIYSGVTENGKIVNLVYRVTGILMVILSLRDSLYSLFKMKTKVNEMISHIQGFANINLGSPLSKLSQFAAKFKVDTEASSELANREIVDENRTLTRDIKTISASPVIKEPVNTEPVQQTASTNDFMFDF